MIKTLLFDISRFFYCIYEITDNKHLSRKIRITLLKNFLRITLKRIITKKLNRNITREKFLDFRMVVDTYENFYYLFQEIFVHQYYYFVTDKKNPLIIDCGANIGMSVFFFKLIYPESRIIAFEPNPISFRLLKENIEQNNVKDITLINAAVCDFEGKIRFNIHESRLDFIKNEKKENNCIFVKSLKLSEFITSELDLLKMDIEGAESKVLSDIKNKLKLVHQIIFEYHERGNVNALSEILKNLGGFKLIFTHSSMKRVPVKNSLFTMMVYGFR